MPKRFGWICMLLLSLTVWGQPAHPI
ncbi:MAG: hypothetical protein QOK38_2368, partial [Acidobacteriaceae bacterium]|nr:hypothetical protein [Acidobacteriaceae bacterium]